MLNGIKGDLVCLRLCFVWVLCQTLNVANHVNSVEKLSYLPLFRWRQVGNWVEMRHVSCPSGKKENVSNSLFFVGYHGIAAKFLFRCPVDGFWSLRTSKCSPRPFRKSTFHRLAYLRGVTWEGPIQKRPNRVNFLFWLYFTLESMPNWSVASNLAVSVTQKLSKWVP